MPMIACPASGFADSPAASGMGHWSDAAPRRLGRLRSALCHAECMDSAGGTCVGGL